MRPLAALALLAAAGCAPTPAAPAALPRTERGFATDRSLACAHLVLEQRGYLVQRVSRRGDVRAEKTFSSRDRETVVHVAVTARLTPAADGRATLWVRTSRRLGAGSTSGRRDPSGRLYASAYFEAAEVDHDAAAVLQECTLGPADG